MAGVLPIDAIRPRGLGPISPVPSVGRSSTVSRGAAVRVGRETDVDSFDRVSSVDPLSLQAGVQVATQAALAPAGLSAARHRSVMGVLRNLG